jgi:hypothetical protein
VLTAPKYTFKPQKCFRHRILSGLVNIDTIFLVVFVVILFVVTIIVGGGAGKLWVSVFLYFVVP